MLSPLHARCPAVTGCFLGSAPQHLLGLGWLPDSGPGSVQRVGGGFRARIFIPMAQISGAQDLWPQRFGLRSLMDAKTSRDAPGMKNPTFQENHSGAGEGPRAPG